MVLGRQESRSCGYFHVKMRGSRRTAKSDRSKPALLLERFFGGEMTSHRFPSPPRTTGTRALLRRRRSLDRSIARSRAHGVALAMEVAFGYTARHARHTRTRTSSPRIARVITAPFPDVNHSRARRSLARSSAAAYVATPHTASARVIYLSGGGCDGGGDRGL